MQHVTANNAIFIAVLMTDHSAARNTAAATRGRHGWAEVRTVSARANIGGKLVVKISRGAGGKL